MQTARPASDASILGTWATQAGAQTNLYTSLTVSGDTTYVESPEPPGTPAYRVALGSVSDPDVPHGHTTCVRFRKNQTGGDAVSLQIRLLAGTKAIYTAVCPVGDMWANHIHSLNGAEYAELAKDYANLELELCPMFAGSANPRKVQIARADMETPDAGPAVQWKIIYADLTTYSSMDGVWTDAPQEQVGIVLGRDPNIFWSRLLVQGFNYYHFQPQFGDPAPISTGDLSTFVSRNGVTPPDPFPSDPRAFLTTNSLIDEVKFGVLLDPPAWSNILNVARADPDFLPLGTPKGRVGDWRDATLP